MPGVGPSADQPRRSYARGAGEGVSLRQGRRVERKKALAEGKAIIISGLRKDGTEFKCCAQFDAAQRQVVVCHPAWFKEAIRAGMDAGQSQSKGKSQTQSEGQEQNNAQTQAQEQQKSQRRSVRVK